MADSTDFSERMRRYLADAAFALVATAALALLLASFAAAGIITMTLAIIFLAAIFVVVLGSTFFLDHLFNPTWEQRFVIGAILLMFLVLTGTYEWTHYAPPPSVEEIADAVSKIVGAKDQPHSERARHSAHISIECSREILPKLLKANEIIHVLQVFPTPIEHGGGGLASRRIQLVGRFAKVAV